MYLDIIISVYNDFREFIDTFKRIEEILNRELYLSDWVNSIDVSTRTLELKYMKEKKS